MNNNQRPNGVQGYRNASSGKTTSNSGGTHAENRRGQANKGNGAAQQINDRHTASGRPASPGRQQVQHKTVRPQKLQLTPEQIEINKANRRRELYYQRKKRAAARRVFLTRFALYLTAVVLVGAFVIAAFWINLTYTGKDTQAKYTYLIGEEKSRLSYSEAVRDGRVYLSFTDVAKLCDFAITGSPEDMNFVIKGDEDIETIRFIADSRVAYVNGIETRLGSAAVYEDGEVYVPVEFVSAYIRGVNVELNEKSNEVRVQRVVTNLGENGKLPKGEDPIYMEPTFLLQSAQGLKPLNEDDLADVAELPDLGFATNMVIFEQYMNPGNITDYLTLVSRDYQLSPDYAPQDLMGLVDTRKDAGRQTQQMREYAAWSMEAMFKELRAAGYDDVSITSAYRSYSYQETIFNSYLAQHNYNYEYVSTFSNPPGASEHQLGLCADLHNLPAADVSFAETEAFLWLRDNCWKFGFILRYPKDKVDVTGVSFEPWHYRYVGRYHSQRIYEEGLCLEEYMEKYYPELMGKLPDDGSAL